MTESRVVSVADSPYKGLAPFEDNERDAMLFFGREREREIIAANLMAYRLTVLYGASGVGKSSVLRAGVAHNLRLLAGDNRARLGHPQLAVAVFGTWSGDPVTGLLAEVRRELVELFGDDRVAESSGRLSDSLAEWSVDLDCEIYVVLDQMDEYFLYHDGDDDFVLQFADAATREGLRVNFLLATREDMLAKLDRFKGRIQNLFSNYLRLDHLDREAARTAIVGPIERHNEGSDPGSHIAVEPTLVAAVLDQTMAGRVRLDDEPAEDRVERPGRVEAPYLQLVMQRLWEEEGGSGTLRLTTLERLGGATEIVRTHLGAALAALNPAEQDLAETLFNYLVTPSGTKIAHGLGDLAQYASVPERTVLPILATLVEERIVRPVTEGGAAEVSRYEIYHDVLAEPVSAWRTRHASERELAEQRRTAERRHRRMAAVTAVSLAALAAMVLVTVFALYQRNEAREQTDRAERATSETKAAALTATAFSLLTVNPERSLRLSRKASRKTPNRAVETALRDALIATNGRAVLRAGGGRVVAAEMNRDGTRVLVAGRHEVRVFRVFRGPSPQRIRLIRTGLAITDADISPNGKLTAIAAGRTVTLRRVDTGARQWPAARRHKKRVNSTSFSADGSQLVTGSEDGAVRLYRVADGTSKEFANGAAVQSALISADGSRIVTVPTQGSGAQFAQLFDTRTARLVQSLGRGRIEKVPSFAAFSPDSRLVVIGAGNVGRVWRAKSGEAKFTLPEAVGPVVNASFSSDSATLAIADENAQARIYDMKSGALTNVFTGHVKNLRDVSFFRNDLIVTAGDDGSARVWREKGLQTSVLLGHRDSVTSAVFAPGGNRILTGSMDGFARLWDPHGAEPLLRRIGTHGENREVSDVAFSTDGKRILSSGGGTAQIRRVRGGNVDTLPHGGTITGSVLAGDVVVTAGANGMAKVWRSGAFKRRLNHGAAITAVAATRGSQIVVTGDAEGLIRIWRVGAQTIELRHAAGVNSLAIDAGGRRLLSASDDRTAVIWRLSDGRPLHVLRGHTDAVLDAAFSPDGRYVATASKDDTARLWDARMGALLDELNGHTDTVTSLNFSPDGRWLVTASADADARVWSVPRGTRIARLRGHLFPIYDAAFSFDGRWVVTASASTGALWEVATGRRLFFFGLGPKPRSIAFSPSGWRIVTGGADGAVRTYNCRLCSRLPGLQRMARERLAALRPRR